MELVQSLLRATTAVVSPDLLDKIVKVSLEKNWGIRAQTAQTRFYGEWCICVIQKLTAKQDIK